MVQLLQGSSLDERVTRLHGLVTDASERDIQAFRSKLDLSWIYHDSALEGMVYTFDELKGAINNQPPPDHALVPIYDEIKQQKTCIDFIRETCQKKRLVINLDLVKKIYVTLDPEEGETKGGPKYRKDMPLHRSYFHDILPPDKITGQMKQLITWVNATDTRRSTHTVRLAAKLHYRLLHIFPYPRNSGKVARLLMNLMLMKQGYPPAVIHATERQRYYDSLRTSEEAAAKLVTEALGTSVESAIRHFEDAALETRRMSAQK